MKPTIFILFGATGDLAKRMVLPAFYGLAAQGLLPEQWALVGNGRGEVSDDAFRAEIRTALNDTSVEVDEKVWSKFASHLKFAGGGFTADNPGQMLNTIESLRSEMPNAVLVHYLAVPPTSFRGFTAAISAHGLADGSKVVFEKPYGTSPQDFVDLDGVVHKTFDESQVFRIDHFLGKEASQNIHTARFANNMLNSAWSREFVSAVQIDIPETLDINDRAEFYDKTGAFLDMIVTHLFQLAAEVAMEPPATMHANDLADARSAVISAFRPIEPTDVVLGQFDGYTQTAGVDSKSKTDTFVAARLWVDTDRWHGVPFLLRTGKQMAAKAERVTLIMRRADSGLHHQPSEPASITFDLAGDGAIETSLTVKKPGPGSELSEAVSTIKLGDIVDTHALAPYERLIHDVVVNDKSRFTRPDGLQAAWHAVEKFLDSKPDPITYTPGSWGPPEAQKLAAPWGWLVGE